MDLQELRVVLEEPGPYLSLHLDVGRDDEEGEERAESRWTTVHHALERCELPEALIEDIGERVRANTHLPGEVHRTIVASPERVLLDDVQQGHDSQPEVVDHGPLPLVTPWLEHQDQGLPFVLAVTNREGADISAYRALHRGRPQRQDTVTGETFYITKVAEGDWAQKQFQRTAENTWHHNAELVADGIRSAARGAPAQAVFVAGEVRARSEVLRALHQGEHEHLGTIVELDSGGRAEGASTEALWGEIQERVRELVAERDADVAAQLQRAQGQDLGGSATGLAEVLDALAKSQVDRLVLDPAAVEELRVNPGEHPGLPLPEPAASAADLPADRTLVAAAALTGASLTLLPSTVSGGDGVSALLRWEG